VTEAPSLPARIEVGPLDQAILSRYRTEYAFSHALEQRFQEEADAIQAEIQHTEKRLSFLQERLQALQVDLVGASASAQESDGHLRSVTAQVLAREGVPESDFGSYGLDVTPSGTVTSLMRKE
jgi:hypothetical protein